MYLIIKILINKILIIQIQYIDNLGPISDIFVQNTYF